MQDHPVRCIQNPAVGREAELGMGTLEAAGEVKRVVVIGGGPAGMKAAEVAARRGHEVQLYEEKEELGGQVNLAAKIPYREEVKDVVRYLGIQLERLGVAVHLGRRVSVEEAAGMACDVLVVATGSRPAAGEEIEGYDGDNVLSVWDVLLGSEVGEHVVLYDITRRWAGLGTAEYLVNLGSQVDLVVPTFSVGEQLSPDNVMLTFERVLEKGLNVIPNASLKRIEKGRVVLENVYSHREKSIEGVDTVVLSVGNRSERKMYDALKGKTAGELYFVGDSVAPRQIQQVIFEAEQIGRAI
jgi:NADPH-dependent 2,4-dienoyl-CoA reductase/sulfur reductase-like enzyme